MSIDNRVNILLNSLPSFFFFSNYLIILFLWYHKLAIIVSLCRAEIYHNAHDSQHVGIEKLRPVFLTITFTMYAAASILYMLDFLLYPEKHLNVPQSYVLNPIRILTCRTNPVEAAIFLFTVGLYLCTSSGM